MPTEDRRPMELVRVWIFPAIALLGSGLLLGVEVRVLIIEKRLGHPRWIRFVRRALGAASIAAIGLMLHFSKLPQHATRADVEPLTYYWMTVIGLALLAIFLAFWDVIDGIRHLRSHLEQEAHGELEILRSQLRNGKKQP